MRPFQCQLCSETYLGEERPDRCPFCGAPGEIMASAPLWIDYGVIEMGDVSKENCRRAMKLEVSNKTFYQLCVKEAENQMNRAIFKRLSKHEAEHAELLAKMLGEDEPDPGEETAPKKDSEKFQESHGREGRAINFYLQAASEAQEARVAEVFRYLAEVESEHLRMSNNYQ